MFRLSGGGRVEGGRESCFSGPRNASPQEISPSNYRAGERQLFVLPFITLIDKTELGWSHLMGVGGAGRAGMN